MELVPILGGAAAGMAIHAFVAAGSRLGWAAGASVVIGFLAAAISGELAESVAFLLIDVPLAMLACVATIAVCARAPRPWRRAI